MTAFQGWCTHVLRNGFDAGETFYTAVEIVDVQYKEAPDVLVMGIGGLGWKYASFDADRPTTVILTLADGTEERIHTTREYLNCLTEIYNDYGDPYPYMRGHPRLTAVACEWSPEIAEAHNPACLTEEDRIPF